MSSTSKAVPSWQLGIEPFGLGLSVAALLACASGAIVFVVRAVRTRRKGGQGYFILMPGLWIGCLAAVIGAILIASLCPRRTALVSGVMSGGTTTDITRQDAIATDFELSEAFRSELHRGVMASRDFTQSAFVVLSSPRGFVPGSQDSCVSDAFGWPVPLILFQRLSRYETGQWPPSSSPSGPILMNPSDYPRVQFKDGHVIITPAGPPTAVLHRVSIHWVAVLSLLLIPAFVWSIFVVPRKILLSRRRRRNECLGCGYPLSALRPAAAS